MDMREIINLVEDAHPSGLLYRGTLENVTGDYLRRNAMIGHTIHYIPEINRRVRGLSTGIDPEDWGRRYRYFWVLDGGRIMNQRWLINGQATLELTDHMARTKTDQPSWLAYGKSTDDYLHAYEHDRKNEMFIKGDLQPINEYCVKMMYRKINGWEDLTKRFCDFAQQYDIPIEEAYW